MQEYTFHFEITMAQKKENARGQGKLIMPVPSRATVISLSIFSTNLQDT